METTESQDRQAERLARRAAQSRAYRARSKAAGGAPVKKPVVRKPKPVVYSPRPDPFLAALRGGDMEIDTLLKSADEMIAYMRLEKARYRAGRIAKGAGRPGKAAA